MPIEVEVQRRLLDALVELEGAAQGAGQEEQIERLAAFRESITDQRLRIAVVGELGNGKSTLIGSLLGQPLLPMGIAPVTRAMASVSRGAEDRVLLVYRDGVRIEAGSDDLRDLGAEQVRRLDQILVESASPMLDEAVFLDTPGLQAPEGSSSDATQEIITRSDCVIVVLNADRLLSLTERDFLQQQVLAQDARQVIFVLNRCDGKGAKDQVQLMDRARHLLEGLLPEVHLFPYAALRSLQARINGDEKAAAEADPEGLQAFIRKEWLDKRSSILTGGIRQKLDKVAADLEDRFRGMDRLAAASLEEIGTSIQAAEAANNHAQITVDGACRRAVAGLEAIQEQFAVGLKDFALKLRESVPRQLMRVPVDDARRFLPFFIQDTLKRAVDANEEPVHAAVARLVEGLSEEAAAALQPLLKGFQVEVEPPAIPLYLTRDRAPLSQGATFVMVAAGTLLFTQFNVGLLVLASGIMSREVGRQLEAADRRAGLGASAQSLVHGSIETMERSIQEQFRELQASVEAALRETFAPQLGQQAANLERLHGLREEALRDSDRVAALTGDARLHLQAATELLKGLTDEG
ncbi:MAG: dynamin family protein [Armatimonadota bacterium]|nr:dynamin family protein [Armatimonadota bacterium]